MKENEMRIWFGIIPCYLNMETMEVRGRNRFYNGILNVYTWIELKLGYYIKEEE